MSDISQEALDWLESVIDRKIQNGLMTVVISKHRSKVLETDTNDVTWVSIPGVAEKFPVSTRFVEVSDGDIVYVSIENGTAYIESNASSPSATTSFVSNSMVTSLGPIYNSIDSMTLKHLDLESLIAETAEFVNASVQNLTAEKADIDFANIVELFATHVSTDRLDAIRANITQLVSEAAMFESLKAEYGEIGDLRSRFADIDFANILQLDAHHAHVGQAAIDQLVSAAGMFDSIRVGDANVTDLRAHFADIDLANVQTLIAESVDAQLLEAVKARLTYLIAHSAYVDRLVAQDGSFTDYLQGVTILGDLIKANTIMADRIIYPGENGMYYMLNYHGGYSQVVMTVDMDPSEEGLLELVETEDPVTGEISVQYVPTQDTTSFIWVRVLPVSADANPSEAGYYESDGQGGYVPSARTATVVYVEVQDLQPEDNPSDHGYYESDGEGGYVQTQDTAPESGKTYYRQESDGITYYVKSLNGKKYYIQEDGYDIPLDDEKYRSALDGSRIVANSITANQLNVENITATGNAFMNNLKTRLLEADEVRIGANEKMHILVADHTPGVEGGENQPELGFYNGKDTIYAPKDFPKDISELYEEVGGLSASDDPEALGYYESDGQGGFVLTDDTSPEQGKIYYVKRTPFQLGYYEVDGVDGLGNPVYVPTLDDEWLYLVVEDPEEDPSDAGYYEYDDQTGVYSLTQDTTIVSGKDYYVQKHYYNYQRNFDARVAYIDGRQLLIPFSVVLNQMMLGDWAWTYRHNGNMDLVYMGSED